MVEVCSGLLSRSGDNSLNRYLKSYLGDEKGQSRTNW